MAAEERLAASGVWYQIGDTGGWRVRAMRRDADDVRSHSPWRYFTVY